MAGLVEDLVDGARLHDLAGVHDVHIIGDFGHNAQVVGDVDDRDAALFLDGADQLQDFGLNGHVQSGGGLITDEQVGVAGQRDGDDHALPHTAGQLMGVVLHPLFRIGDAHLFQQLHSLFVGLILGHFEVPEHSLHDLLADLHGGVQAGHGVLEHHGDPLAVDVAADPLFVFLQQVHGLRGAVGVVVAELDGAAVDDGVLGQDAHGGFHGDGLARAGLADQSHRLALVQVDVHAADGVDLACGGLKGDVEVTHRQHLFFFVFRHGVFLLTCSSSWGPVPRADHRPPG